MLRAVWCPNREVCIYLQKPAVLCYEEAFLLPDAPDTVSKGNHFWGRIIICSGDNYTDTGVLQVAEGETCGGQASGQGGQSGGGQEGGGQAVGGELPGGGQAVDGGLAGPAKCTLLLTLPYTQLQHVTPASA